MGYEVQAVIKRKGIATLIRGIWYTFLVTLYMVFYMITMGLLAEVNAVLTIILAFTLFVMPIIIIAKISRKKNKAILNLDYGMNLYLRKGNKQVNVNLYERQNAKKLKVINYTYSNRIQFKIKEYLGKYKVTITGENNVRQSLLPMLNQNGINIIEIYDEPSDDAD